MNYTKKVFAITSICYIGLALCLWGALRLPNTFASAALPVGFYLVARGMEWIVKS